MPCVNNYSLKIIFSEGIHFAFIISESQHKPGGENALERKTISDD